MGLTDWVTVTCVYSKTRVSVALVKVFVTPLHGVANGPGGQVAPEGQVLSAQVQTLETVGVIPEGKSPVICAAVTLGLALPTSAPARVALSRVVESTANSP
jgi:hypothetical protein